MQNITLEMLLWSYLPACPPEGRSYAWWKGSATSSKTQRTSWGTLGSRNISGGSQLSPHTITCDMKVRLQMKPFFMLCSHSQLYQFSSCPNFFFFRSYWLKKKSYFECLFFTVFLQERPVDDKKKTDSKPCLIFETIHQYGFRRSYTNCSIMSKRCQKKFDFCNWVTHWHFI